ncbi:Cell_division protein 50 [Hexamita inflata]|uniref:Cell division protein 50 n=1 Tax=Hexamita inflata TaxID=28002 RepID=A0AA86VL27_9EUKA|nr:Cell division protein 50 [Hexamita inflata]
MGLLSIDSKLANTPFFQQNMKHCIPSYHPLILSTVFSILGIAFCIFGPILMSQSKSLLYFKTKHENDKTESISVSLKIDPNKPLALYYQVPDFYQNIRSYVQSFNLTQLASDSFTKIALDESCSSTSAANAVNYPCGLIYKTRVDKDQYTIKINSKSVSMTADIIRKSDIKQNNFFGKAFKQLPNWQRTADWMRPGPFKDIQKTFSAASKDELKQLNVDFKNNVTVDFTMSGKHDYSPFRNVILAQAGIFGNKNETQALGIISLAFGVVCIACVLLYFGAFVASKTMETQAEKKVRGWKLTEMKVTRTEPKEDRQ